MIEARETARMRKRLCRAGPSSQRGEVGTWDVYSRKVWSLWGKIPQNIETDGGTDVKTLEPSS